MRPSYSSAARQGVGLDRLDIAMHCLSSASDIVPVPVPVPSVMQRVARRLTDWLVGCDIDIAYRFSIAGNIYVV